METTKNKELRASFLLLLTAFIWGFAFIAQRVGAQYLGAFAFNGIRFVVGGISLIPVMMFLGAKEKDGEVKGAVAFKPAVFPGIMAGGVLFCAATFQQIGLAYTTAGKAAFITGLYIVLVPVLGIFLKHRVRGITWAGVVLAITGLFFLSVREDFTIAKGDFLEIIGAFFWATHILLIDHYVKKVDSLKLSFVQFLASAAFSLCAAFIFEDISLTAIKMAIIPILYAGVLSVGVGYTLQVIGQKHAKPAHAAIILSMESVFAAIGGKLMLNESLGMRGLLGCALMLSGMLLSQLQDFGSGKEQKELSEHS